MPKKFAMRYLLLAPMLMGLAGCPVTQPQESPARQVRMGDKKSPCRYWLYVPSYYSEDHAWPLVITLHGTPGFDSSDAQIREWKSLAEEQGFLVAAPDLQSAQGVLPVSQKAWQGDLKADEQAILALREEVLRSYRIDPRAILLTGFSAGGFPMYYTGLRHSDKFSMLIGRSANSRVEILEQLPVTDATRKMPIALLWGKDDIREIQQQNWEAFRWLREHRFFAAREPKQVRGGHLRRPELAYNLWKPHLPAELQTRPE